MNDIMKIVQVLENLGILLKSVTKTIKNETKSQSGNGIGMILGTLAASLLENLLAGKGIIRAGYGNKQGKGIIRAGCENKEGILKKALIPPHLLTNFKIEEYFFKNKHFNGVYSRDNLFKVIKNGAYVINLDEYADVGTHWIALYVKNNEVIYFDSFGVDCFH